MNNLSELIRAKIKPEPIQYVSPVDMQKLRELGMQATGADSARERRLAREARYELLLLLEPTAVLHQSLTYDGKVMYTTVQDQIDLINSGI